MGYRKARKLAQKLNSPESNRFFVVIVCVFVCGLFLFVEVDERIPEGPLNQLFGIAVGLGVLFGALMIFLISVRFQMHGVDITEAHRSRYTVGALRFLLTMLITLVVISLLFPIKIKTRDQFREVKGIVVRLKLESSLGKRSDTHHVMVVHQNGEDVEVVFKPQDWKHAKRVDKGDLVTVTVLANRAFALRKEKDLLFDKYEEYKIVKKFHQRYGAWIYLACIIALVWWWKCKYRKVLQRYKQEQSLGSKATEKA